MDLKSLQEKGLFGSAKRFTQIFIESFQTRLELFSLEYREERIRLIILMVLAIVGLFLASLGLIVLTLGVIFVMKDGTARLITMGIFVLLYFSLSGACIYALLTKVGKNYVPFSQTIEQLKKDVECLKS
ncbi:MAG: phage holin family protein [Verrucomicrobiota bacterium]